MLVLDIVERGVERFEVLFGNVLRFVADGLQQLHIDLQRRVGELSHDLRFGDDFCGHEVQKQQLQGTDVLMHGAVFGHYEDVFALENLGCWKRIGNPDRHNASFLLAALSTFVQMGMRLAPIRIGEVSPRETNTPYDTSE